MSDAPLYDELAQYFEFSPNALVAGCMNTHEHTDGVVFPGIEPQEDAFCFVGRPSIISAVAVLYEMTPDEVMDHLEGNIDDNLIYIKSLEKELKELRTFKAKVEKVFNG